MDNPVLRALKKAFEVVMPSCVATVDQLVNEDDEADIVLTNDRDKALSFFKDTEHAIIVLLYFRQDHGELAKALSARFPERIKAIALFDHGNESDTNNYITRITPVINAVRAAKGEV